MDGSAHAYMPVAQLKAYFVETFNMLDDLNRNLDVLLKHGFIEANSRLDAFSEEVDSVKITAYGRYMYGELAYFFSYLDLVCTDCGIFDQQTSNYLVEAANEEYGMFLRGARQDRVGLRLGRVEQFINYLSREESRENDLYKLGIKPEEMLTHKAAQDFAQEKRRVLASAARQTTKWKERGSRPRL